MNQEIWKMKVHVYVLCLWYFFWPETFHTRQNLLVCLDAFLMFLDTARCALIWAQCRADISHMSGCSVIRRTWHKPSPRGARWATGGAAPMTDRRQRAPLRLQLQLLGIHPWSSRITSATGCEIVESLLITRFRLLLWLAPQLLLWLEEIALLGCATQVKRLFSVNSRPAVKHTH